MKAPCKDCNKRYVGCHGRCEKYQEYYKANQQRLDEIKKANEYDQYQSELSIRIRKHTRR